MKKLIERLLSTRSGRYILSAFMREWISYMVSNSDNIDLRIALLRVTEDQLNDFINNYKPK